LLPGAQTSSPSYLLMSSLDAARAHAQLPGTFSEPLQAAALANARLRDLPGIALLHDRLTPGAHLMSARSLSGAAVLLLM
jgi:arginine/lysine/ornithine decarboxylase